MLVANCVLAIATSAASFFHTYIPTKPASLTMIGHRSVLMSIRVQSASCFRTRTISFRVRGGFFFGIRVEKNMPAPEAGALFRFFFWLFQGSLRLRAFTVAVLSTAVYLSNLQWACSVRVLGLGPEAQVFSAAPQQTPIIQWRYGFSPKHCAFSLVVKVLFRLLVVFFPPKSRYILLLQDVEVTSPPDDSISCLAFSPPTLPGNFLIGGSWANDVS